MYEKIKNKFKDKYFLALLGVIALAIFFRFFQLGTLPPGLHPDEAANGLDIISCLEQGVCQVFYNTNGPREALFFYIQAIGVFFFGHTQLGIRFGAGLVSVLAIIATYFLGKELFSKRVGILSAFAMTVLPWYLVISRDGFRANLTPLFIATTIYFGIKAYRTKSIGYFIAFGASFALGFHSYLAYRLFPLALIALFAFFLIVRRDILKNIWELRKNVLVSMGAFAAVLAPLILYFIKHPEDSGARTAGTSILNPDLNGGNPLGFLLENIKKTLLMFHFTGDANYRHNSNGLGMIDPLAGIAFVIGLIYSFLKIVRKLDWRHFMLLMVFGAMIGPMILTAEGIPHGLRVVGIVPVVAIYVALGIDLLWRRWEKDFTNKSAKTLGLATIILFVIFSVAYNYVRYFSVYAKSVETHEAYSEDMAVLAKRLNESQAHIKHTLIIGEYSDKTVAFLTHDKKPNYKRIEPRDILKIQLEPGLNKFYIERSMFSETEKILPSIAPEGTFKTISGFDGRPILYLYEVNI